MAIGIKFSVSQDARAEIANFIRIEADVEESHKNMYNGKHKKELCEYAAQFARRLARQIEMGEL